MTDKNNSQDGKIKFRTIISLGSGRFHTNNKVRKLTIFVLPIILVLGGILTYAKYFNQKDQNSTNSKVSTETTEELAVSEKTPTVITKSETICLDPGHGGSDTGAIYKKLTESSINLDVAEKVRSLLEADGYKVYLTRSDDTFVAKRDRARYCNSVDATILVSVHHNTYEDDTSVNYDTVLYYKDIDQALASSIINATSAKLGVKNQGISKFNNSLFWIAKMPSVLSESFFLTNKTEYADLTSHDSTRLSDEAVGIAEGIKNYFLNPNQTASTVDADSLIIDRSNDD